MGSPQQSLLSSQEVLQKLAMEHSQYSQRLEFSKKLDNHAYAVALHFMYMNYVRIHSSLRVTPAMEAGLSDHAWDLAELVGLLSN